MTDDILAFIESRLTEDEAMISRNSEGHGLADGFPDYRTYDGPDADAADDYIHHFGPVRALGGVKAKRKVLAVAHRLEDSGRTLAASEVRRALASEWDTHPDYRPEWSL